MLMPWEAAVLAPVARMPTSPRVGPTLNTTSAVGVATPSATRSFCCCCWFGFLLLLKLEEELDDDEEVVVCETKPPLVVVCMDVLCVPSDADKVAVLTETGSSERRTVMDA